MQKLLKTKTEVPQLYLLTTGEVAVLLPLKSRLLNKCVHVSDIFTTPVCCYFSVTFHAPAAVRPCCVQIKAANSTNWHPDWRFRFPMLPTVLCSASFSLASDRESSICPSWGFRHGVFGMLRISPMISNYPPLTDCLVSLAVCRLDMMILRLQCKRIVAQVSWQILHWLQLNCSSGLRHRKPESVN